MKLLTIGTLFLLLVNCQSPKAPQVQFWVGAASESINPPLGSFIAGDQLNRKFEGLHDSLFAKAVVISNGEHTMAIVTLDCIGLLYPEVMRIRQLSAQLTQNLLLPSNHVIVASNHIHSGPDVVGIWGPNQWTSGVDTAYLSHLITVAARQVQKAALQIQAANASFAVGTHGFEWVHNISKPSEIDRSLTTLAFTDQNGNNIATLTNFACHPTFYDAVHDVISADYVGAFYQKMASAKTGEHLFLQGSIGGWVQPDKEDQSFDVGTKRGAGLADATLMLLKQASPLEGTAIDFNFVKFELPVTNPAWQQLAELGILTLPITQVVKSEIAWFRIGAAEFITHPGETPPTYALQSKEWMGSQPTFVIGLGLDAIGYILTPEFFHNEEIPNAPYLTGMSLGESTGPIVLEKIREAIPIE